MRLTHRRDGLKSIVNFLFELGMLKKTPRSGFQFLGSGRESVADHAFRVAAIGYTVARLDKKADAFTRKLIAKTLFPILNGLEEADHSGADFRRIGFIGIQVHREPEIGIHPHQDVTKSQRSFSLDSDADLVFVMEAIKESIFRRHVDVTQRTDDAFF